MKKQFIRITTLVLAVIIMLCPLCVCTASSGIEPENPYWPEYPWEGEGTKLSHDVILYYIYVILQEFGIEISYSNLHAFTGDISQWIDTQLLTWLDTLPSPISKDALFWPWKFLWNPDGYLVANHSALDDIRSFANWLVSQFGLEDNDEVQVEAPQNTIGEMVVYSLPLILTKPRSNGTHIDGWDVTVITASQPVYFYLTETSSSNVRPDLLSTDSGSVDVAQTLDGSALSHSTVNLASISDTVWFGGSSGLSLNKTSWGLGSYASYPYSYSHEILLDNDTISYYGSDMYIITSSITIPSAEQVTDNSIVVTPSGPLYEPVEWDGTVSVDNLPAIVSTGSIRKLDLVSVFAPIKAFANTFSDGFDLMVQIVYNMPTAVVSIALTIMAAIAVFGTIKIFKEH